MAAELRNGTEDYSAVAKATTATAVALDTKAFMVVAADPLSLVALKPSSKSGVDSLVDWMQWFRAHIGTGGPAAVYLVTSLKQVHRVPGRLIGEYWIGSGTLHSVWVCRVKSRAKSSTFDRTRNSWPPTPQTWRRRRTLSRKIQQHLKTQLKIARQKSRGFWGLHQESVWRIGGACEGEVRDLREDRRRWIPGQPVSAAIAWRFGKRTYQKREDKRKVNTTFRKPHVATTSWWWLTARRSACQRRTCQRPIRRKMIRCSLLSKYTKACRGNSNW